jgi:hypothetical protein
MELSDEVEMGDEDEAEENEAAGAEPESEAVE